jgi:hypothetical protein
MVEYTFQQIKEIAGDLFSVCRYHNFTMSVSIIRIHTMYLEGYRIMDRGWALQLKQEE